jgi:hypothetical protein
MSVMRPHGQPPDAERTAFGQCLASVRTLDPTRPDPTQDRPEAGGGLFSSSDSDSRYSPFPSSSLSSIWTNPLTLEREVWQTLIGGLHALSPNDYGRPWPYPDRRRLAELLAEHDEDLCRKAAIEAKSIVQGQDRAPNITALFEKKLRDLAEERRYEAEVRRTVRDSLARAT